MSKQISASAPLSRSAPNTYKGELNSVASRMKMLPRLVDSILDAVLTVSPNRQ